MKESIIFNEHNLTEKIHYVYRVTIDEQYYGGKHSGRLDDLHTGRYKTSSKLVKEKLENGHRFTKIKILGVFSTEKEAYEFEEKYLTRVDAKRNPKFLNQTNGGKNFYNKQHTEETKKKISEKTKEQFDINTEQGRKNLEEHTRKQKEARDENTERGRKLRENHSDFMTEKFDPNTEEGRKNREYQSKVMIEKFDPNTEEGIKRREDMSEKMKEFYNPNTEQGRRNKEKRSQSAKVGAKKGVKTLIQNRKDASILGELMFDEEFIKENFLIFDDKNNLRFLSSVYSKLSGYSESHISKEKREGKLSFLSKIKSKKLTEEQENAKIKEIEAIIKSRNEELSLKAS